MIKFLTRDPFYQEVESEAQVLWAGPKVKQILNTPQEPIQAYLKAQRHQDKFAWP
jgi:hypothetical protein